MEALLLLNVGPSPTELILEELAADARIQQVAPGGVRGTVTGDEQMLGAISLSDGGTSAQDQYLPLRTARVAIKCHALSKAAVEHIATVVYLVLHRGGRRVRVQRSTGERFLIHWSMVNGGPSHGMENERIWEENLYIDCMIGTEAIDG